MEIETGILKNNYIKLKAHKEIITYILGEDIHSFDSVQVALNSYFLGIEKYKSVFEDIIKRKLESEVYFIEMEQVNKLCYPSYLIKCQLIASKLISVNLIQHTLIQATFDLLEENINLLELIKGLRAEFTHQNISKFPLPSGRKNKSIQETVLLPEETAYLFKTLSLVKAIPAATKQAIGDYTQVQTNISSKSIQNRDLDGPPIKSTRDSLKQVFKEALRLIEDSDDKIWE